MTSHDIQKDIVTACKIETVKAIIEDINSDYFALLVDESRDLSRKEQMTICLRYVDKRGFVMETFIELIHIKDTSVLSLKEAIVDLLAHHSLTLSNVREQCYDGTSNMQGRGLNQELGLVKAGDTRWGSHYKSFGNFISSFDSIVNVLDTLVVNASTLEERASASGFLRSCQMFETIFLLHLMTDLLGITNDLNVSLQKKEQDIANAMILVKVAKRSFDIKKIMRMAELYTDDFDESNMRALENQLVYYIIDVRDIDERFSNLGGLGELSRKLAETKKHLNYSLVFLLVKFALLLPVATATIERAFSAMNIIKNDLRNQMDDEFLDGCTVPYVEEKIFKDASNECIMRTFQEMKCHCVQL
ncbi:uncharacterized protein LOC125837404 [Solanum verrucosum]|uniref:uncharacterized protein LOC125837404 n=1 Tax=Solanum verrucosum TaxID=315347 RepID=UPI0020D0FEBE|nr:uncharacterized protein LOC125837404 [Solanum verrucosum]